MIGVIGAFRPSGNVSDFVNAVSPWLPDARRDFQEGLAGDTPRAVIGAHSSVKQGFAGIRSAGGVSVAAVGVIHNQHDLMPDGADRLDDAGNGPASVILALYRAGKLDRLASANGCFAAAVFDGDKNAVTLITDRLATYPIHLARWADGWVFGTAIHPLVRGGLVPAKAARNGIAQLFTMQRTVGTTTTVAGLEAVLAARIVTLNTSGRSESTYSDLAWSETSASEGETVERLVSALKGAVDRQTVAGGAGLLLSGGIDSRLVLGASPKGRLSCWTTASFAENPELEIARQTADLCDAPFTPMIVEPSQTLDFLEGEQRHNGGLYPASLPIAAFMPQVGPHVDSALTGHGLDYTLRGYYLPAKFLKVAGSKTRLPMLRGIPKQPTAQYVLDNLRQGPPRSTVDRIIAPGQTEFWWDGQALELDSVLAPYLQSSVPYNAWDAFLLHSVSKHYAFTGMMAIRAKTHLHIPAFDKEVFDTYLSMPPSWRVAGEVVRKSLRRLSPSLSRLPNANTGFSADTPLWRETVMVLARAASRRLGVARAPEKPSELHSTGSWQSTPQLFRHDPGYRQRFQDIRGRLDTLTLGILQADGLAWAIDEHLDGKRDHTKLLRQLLSHDAWVREYGIAGHD